MAGTDQDISDLEAAYYLGCTLNSLLKVDTVDVGALLDTSPKGARALKIAEKTNVQHIDLTVNKKTVPRRFNCPQNVKILHETQAVNKLVSFDSGSKAESFLEADASASVSYGGLSVSGGTKFSSSSKLSESSIYSFYSWEETIYRAIINEMPQNDIHPDLEAAVTKLPAWDAKNASSIQQFKDFFSSWGTHAITEAKYGWRYVLQISCAKSDADLVPHFEAYVKAEYNGVGSISGSADIKTDKTYQAYQNSSNAQAYVRGGDQAAISQAAEAGSRQIPTDPGPPFQAWLNSTSEGTGEQLLAVTVIALPDILRQNAVTSAAAAPLGQALDFFTTEAAAKHVRGRLFGRSNWLEFQLEDHAPTTFIEVPASIPQPSGDGAEAAQTDNYTEKNIHIAVHDAQRQGPWGGFTIPSWKLVCNLSIPFVLQIGNSGFDPVSFSLNHGAAGGSIDENHFSKVEFYGDDGATVIHSEENWEHHDRNRKLFLQKVLVQHK